MKKKFHFLFTLPTLILLGSTLFFMFLPYLVDLYLLPRLIKELPFTEKELSLSRISPWKVRGTLTLADQDRSTLSLPRFELYYTPGSLLRREIAGILLDSASLHVDIQNGRPVIRGLSGQGPDTPGNDKTSSFLLPLTVKTIILKNCTISLHNMLHETTTVTIDGRFSLDFTEQPEQQQLLRALSGQIISQGDLVASGGIEVRLVENSYGIRLQLEAPDIAQFAALSPELTAIRLTGALSLSGNASINPAENRITRYEATAKVPGFQLLKSGVLLADSSPDTPVTLQLFGDSETTGYTFTGLALVEPEKSTLDLKGEIAITKGTIKGSGHLFLERTGSAVKVEYSGLKNQSGTTLDYLLASDAFTLGDTVSVGPATVDGNVKIEGSTVAGTLNGRVPGIVEKKNKASLVDLSIQLPFHYPSSPQPKTEPGTLNIGKILYQGTNTGRFQASILPSRKGITFNTVFHTSVIPGLRITCDGSAEMTADVSLQCRFPETEVSSTTFPKILSLPKELSFNGKLAAAGEFHLQDKIPTGRVSVDVHDGSMTHGQNSLSNIKLGVVFPNLPLLQSSPGQLCTVGSLNFGKIKLSDARIFFRIEDEQSIFLEKVRASWCGGKVESGSFTLARNMQELDTTLYCDRLGFTELLAQFGIDKAEGQGSLNGRLPVTISKQGLIFDDGFLFSTPGNSGIVRFNDTKQLKQGMPDLGRSAYLDYAMKALENFSYNWTRLSFNSEKDNLLIAMQLDGKPADPLPFGYKNGQIVPSGKGPGLQHPIRLDVNFRLPLQDLFQYGKNIQSFMENM
ncbi:MAG: YdbH domain-containing protein [Desulforhopalus sp.]